MSQSVIDRKYGGVFLDEAIDVTGLTLLQPCFLRCAIERRPTAPEEPRTELWGAQFVSCQLIGDGWPEWMKQASAAGPFNGSDPVPST